VSIARKTGNGVNTQKYHTERGFGDDFPAGVTQIRDDWTQRSKVFVTQCGGFQRIEF
jgi:hypothetical protein